MRSRIFTFILSFTVVSVFGQGKTTNECPAKCRELKNVYQLSKVQEMHDEVNEASGLEMGSGKYIWTHGDGGTGTKLFKLGPDGKMLEKYKLEDLKNNDWEDLTRDKSGNLYIGDFGNNKSDRKDLQILIVPEKDPEAKARKIKFTFADQKEFPPAEGKPQFDCEAFFWHNGQLYLFNKNITCHQYVRVYRLSDQPGTHQAMLIDSIQLNSQISSADISPDGKMVALLGMEELYLIKLNGKNSFSNGQTECLKLPGIGKSEAVVFRNGSDMLLCNENGMMYKLTKNTQTAKGKKPVKKTTKKS